MWFSQVSMAEAWQGWFNTLKYIYTIGIRMYSAEDEVKRFGGFQWLYIIGIDYITYSKMAYMIAENLGIFSTITTRLSHNTARTTTTATLMI